MARHNQMLSVVSSRPPVSISTAILLSAVLRHFFRVHSLWIQAQAIAALAMADTRSGYVRSDSAPQTSLGTDAIMSTPFHSSFSLDSLNAAEMQRHSNAHSGRRVDEDPWKKSRSSQAVPGHGIHSAASASHSLVAPTGSRPMSSKVHALIPDARRHSTPRL